ncbi:MAG TPA: hypothetical protein VIP51_08935 [Eoetvoesiella sp.]
MRQFFPGKSPLLWSCLLLACTPAVGTTQAQWPQAPSRLNFSTPYGNLGVANSDYVYESTLRIDNIDITPEIKGLLNITYAFAMPKAQAALVSISDGNNRCPISYRWVILHSKGYEVSPAFGSCSRQIKVTVAGTKFTLETPNNQKPDKIDIYVYDGKTVKQRTIHPK